MLLSFGCSSQNDNKKNETPKQAERAQIEQPKGTWKVDKEYDEKGNLIRYDSIYSWSSTDKFNDLSAENRDSLIKSFESRFFRNFSHFENDGFPDFFAQDSLLRQRFFNDDFFNSEFGKDFMDIDKVMQQMMERQKRFLEKYNSRMIIPPSDDN